jgi:hypothetical protein
LYLHFQSIDYPFLYARKVQDARSVLTSMEVQAR